MSYEYPFWSAASTPRQAIRHTWLLTGLSALAALALVISLALEGRYSFWASASTLVVVFFALITFPYWINCKRWKRESKMESDVASSKVQPGLRDSSLRVWRFIEKCMPAAMILMSILLLDDFFHEWVLLVSTGFVVALWIALLLLLKAFEAVTFSR